MSPIDLIILGMLIEKPQSAYDLQKQAEVCRYASFAKVSAPSIYRKVLELEKDSYVESEAVKARGKLQGKAVYRITAKGRGYFEQLMAHYAAQPISLQLDFNVVIANLNKMGRLQALPIIKALRQSIKEASRQAKKCAAENSLVPSAHAVQTVFRQQRILYKALLKWLDEFEESFKADYKSGAFYKESDDSDI